MCGCDCNFLISKDEHSCWTWAGDYKPNRTWDQIGESCPNGWKKIYLLSRSWVPLRKKIRDGSVRECVQNCTYRSSMTANRTQCLGKPSAASVGTAQRMLGSAPEFPCLSLLVHGRPWSQLSLCLSRVTIEIETSQPERFAFSKAAEPRAWLAGALRSGGGQGEVTAVEAIRAAEQTGRPLENVCKTAIANDSLGPPSFYLSKWERWGKGHQRSGGWRSIPFRLVVMHEPCVASQARDIWWSDKIVHSIRGSKGSETEILQKAEIS